jgi:hypothetical protein
MRRSLNDLSIHQLEKVLDKWFSYYIRLRDSSPEGYAACCTCKRMFWWKEMDCGHYSKRNLAHRFNEKNCHAQCGYCNDRMKGEADKHGKHIDELYGSGTAELLRGTERTPKNYSRIGLLTLIDLYKSKAKHEAQKRGLRVSDTIPV